MTDKNKAEIIVILDRSGSMHSIKNDMEGGFKAFLEEQRKVAGTCHLSLYQFDTSYEAVFETRPLDSVQGLVLIPRDGTALFDAVGRTINTVGARYQGMPEDQRPGAVIVLIITDGQENASKEFTGAQVKALIERQTAQYQWQFAYLGADISTAQDAAKLGIQMRSVGTYGTGPTGPSMEPGVQHMYRKTSEGVSAYRSAVASNVAGAALNVDLIELPVVDSSTPNDAP